MKDISMFTIRVLIESSIPLWYNPRMKRLHFLRFLILLPVLILIAGCARFPDGTSTTTVREISFQIEFNGPINDNNFYFVPIDTAGGALGPTPVFPGFTTGEGWVTGSATHYVQYHQRQYTLFKITSLQPFIAEPAGVPVRSTLPEFGGRVLNFTLDLNTIAAAGQSIDANIITTDQPFDNVRFLDGLGPGGTDFLTIDITNDRTVTNTDFGTLETAADVLDQNRQRQAPSPLINPLDIVDWRITVDI